MIPQPTFKLVQTPPMGWRLQFANLPVHVVGQGDEPQSPRPLFLIATGEAYIRTTGSISAIRLLQHQHTEWCSPMWDVEPGQLYDLIASSILISIAGKTIAEAVQNLHTQREAA